MPRGTRLSRAKEPQHIYADLPFGGVHTSSGTNITLRFPGQWFQSEAGLHQNWMRDYDPTLGRYIQADPVGLVDGASVYGYALQNPGRYTDPTGLIIPQAVSCLVNPWCRSAAAGAAYVIWQWYFDEDGCYTIGGAVWDFGIGTGVGWGIGKAAAPIFRPNGPFGKGTWMNTGRNWRVGWGRKGGNRVFRSYNRWSGKSGWYDGGPL